VILCVAGNPSVDKLFEIDRIELGSLHRPSHFVQVPGGKGLNVARAAAALGEAVIVTGLLAGHAGNWIDQALAAEGVPHRFAWAASGETRASLSVAESDHRHLTEFYEAGTPVTEREWDAVEEIVAELLPTAAWIAMSGSVPPGSPDHAYARLVAAAHAKGVRSAVDARGPYLVDALSERPDLVKINAHEAGELLGNSVEGVDGAHRAALEIRERAGGEGHAAVVTIGAEGAVLAEPDGTAVHGRLDAFGHYPVGSGDSFLAGLLAGLHRGDTWQQALGLALGTAVANAEMPGAGRLDSTRATELSASAREHVLLSG
jgi:1-phosphofructokinase family hexose kinase